MIESDEKFEPIRKACKQLAGNIARLKQLEQRKDGVQNDSPWHDAPDLEKAWGKLEKAIEAFVPGGTKWWGHWIQFAIEDAWDARENDPVKIAGFLEMKVKNKLPDMQAEWLALTPLGRQFSSFPEFSDFGDFAIINASASNTAEATARLKKILQEHFSVNFIDSDEIDAPFEREADKLAHASLGYFPVRPQLVMQLGRGLAMPNFHDFHSRLNSLAPLIVLSEMAAELFHSRDDPRFDKPWMPDRNARLPDGSPMPFGLIKVPDDVILMDVHRGNVWSPGPLFQRSPDFGTLPFFETNMTPLLDVGQFKEAWTCWAWTIWVLIGAMEEARVNQQFRDAFEGSIRVIAQCRHWRALRLPDPSLYAVIATETLLNPFGKNEKLQERFAKFGAALCETDAAKRAELEARLKELYEQRCDFVHSSGFFYERVCDTEDDVVGPPNPVFALRHFFCCLHHVHDWASQQLRNSEPLSEKAFEEFYRTTVGHSDTTKA